MIRIVTEASQPKKVSSLLEQYKSTYKDDADKISGLQYSLDLLQGMIPPAGIPILQQGVEAIGEALQQLNDLKSSSGGWQIIQPSDENYEHAILPQQLIRSWFWDKKISPTEISTSLDNIYKVGDKIRKVGSVGKNGVAVYDLQITGANSKIITDLYNNGIKGVGRYDQYGCYEKLLSVIMGGLYWPQSGQAGAGDIRNSAGKLIEVKSLDSRSIITTPKIPTGGMIALVREIVRGGKEFLVMLISDPRVLNVICSNNEMNYNMCESIFDYCTTMKKIGTADKFAEIVNLTQTDTTPDTSIEYDRVKKTGDLRVKDKNFISDLEILKKALS